MMPPARQMSCSKSLMIQRRRAASQPGCRIPSTPVRQAPPVPRAVENGHRPGAACAPESPWIRRARSSSFGAAVGMIWYYRASIADITRRMAPPLPAASEPSNAGISAFPELGMAHQFRQAPLPGREFGLVVLLRQTLRHVQRTQHIEAVRTGARTVAPPGSLRSLVGQPLLKRFEDCPADGQRPIAIVGSLDDDPGRPRRSCGAQPDARPPQASCRRSSAGPNSPWSPASGSTGWLPDRHEALALPFFEMDPELGTNAPSLTSISSKRLSSSMRWSKSDRERSPAIDRRPATNTMNRRQFPIRPFFGSARQKRHIDGRCRSSCVGAEKVPGGHVARIHPLVEGVDGVALARSVDAADQDDDRKGAVFAQFILCFEQRRAQPVPRP